MLAIISKIVIFSGSFAMLASAMFPAYVLVIYSVFRPLLQPFSFMQYQLFGLPISIPFSIIIVGLGVLYMGTKPGWRFQTDKAGFLTAFMMLGLLSTAFSVDAKVSLIALSKLATVWFIFNIAFNAIKTKEDIHIILYGLMISSLIPMLIGFYQSFTGQYNFLLDATVDRLSSVFGVGNAYGIFLSVITAAVAILLLNAKSKKERMILIATLVAILVSQVLALNRGTWLALGGGFVVAAFKFRRYISFKWVALLAVFIVIFFSKTIYDRFGDLENRARYTGQNTLEGRVEYWKEIIPLIANKPVTGYGVGTTGLVSVKYLHTAEVPHNDFIRIALETGIIGVFLYFLFLAKLVYYFYMRPLYKELWPYNFAMLMLCCYFIVISSTQNVVYNLINFPAFLIMVAIGIKVNNLPGFRSTGDSDDDQDETEPDETALKMTQHKLTNERYPKLR